MLLQPSWTRNLIGSGTHFTRIMSRQSTLKVSPPEYTGARDILDKGAFRTSVSILAARVSPPKTGVVLRSEVMRRSIMDLPRLRSVVPSPADPEGERLVLLNVEDPAELQPETLEFLKAESKGFVDYTLELNYDYWTADDILQSVLPEELREGAPNGFAITGHIAHMNLNDEYLPYKHIIGQVVLDKNAALRTVVNKLDSIDTQFRFFKMELIAGEPDFVVQHHESDCVFNFDFTQVYWNSRLHHEHDRLVKAFNPRDVVVDVFAGVGPFAVPAGRKGCAVFANDLNPNSAKYLAENVKGNRVDDLVRVFCEDGRDFIRKAAARAYNDPFPAYTGPRLSRSQQQQLERNSRKSAPSSSLVKADEGPAPPRQRISHFVMNLPDSAIQFLDAFRGILSDENRNLSGIYDVMPMIHCHCFTRELEPDKAEEDIRKRVEEKLGFPVTEDVSLHLVRSVAPNKDMYCISFRLPWEVARVSL